MYLTQQLCHLSAAVQGNRYSVALFLHGFVFMDVDGRDPSLLSVRESRVE